MRSFGPAGILSLLAIACAEPRTAPPPEPDHEPLRLERHSASYLEEGDQNAPPGVPREFQFPTILHSVEADAGWLDGIAYAGAIVRYTATNALARVTLETPFGSEMLESQTYQMLPAYAEHQKTTNRRMDQCSGPIRGVAYGLIWNTFFNMSTFQRWGDKSDSDAKDRECPRTVSRASNGVNVGGDGLTCYTLTTDHYWYFPDTKTTQYRYSETERWCDKSGSYAV